MRLNTVIFYLGCSILSACTSSPSKETAPPTAPAVHKTAVRTEALEPYSCGTIERLHTLGGVFLASQPSAEDFQHAKEGGVKTVIDFRMPGELKEFDEPAVVKGLGLEYVNLGFNSPQTLNDEIFDQARKLLREEPKKPILAHCHSGNRVGAIWLAHRVLDGGLSWDAALQEAKDVGLKAPAFEQRAKDYVESHRTSSVIHSKS